MIVILENLIKSNSNANEEFYNILKQNDTVLVDFFATWCGPCRMLMPLLEKVSERLENLLIIKIDVDKFPELASWLWK